MEDSVDGKYRDFKKRKIWVDKKSGYKCMMLYARSLAITWNSPVNWSWNCYKETSDDNIEVAKLIHVDDLDVRGQFKMSELSPGVDYEIGYIVKLTNGVYGWELPVTLKIKLSGQEGKEKKQQCSLLEKPRGMWIELIGGSFQSVEGEDGEVSFDLYHRGDPLKSGLIIRGIVIRPKN